MLCRALMRRAGVDNVVMQAVLPWLSLIVPVLDEGPALESALQALAARPGVELMVVDGGSSDASLALAHQWADLALSAPRGRAVQMNAGAAVARGQWLLFVHADTRLPAQAWQQLDQLPAGSLWGRFDVRIDDPHWLLALVGFMMNLRSRLSGIATGDQAIFVRREVFEELGGFPDIALMEDIALSRKLKALGRPVCLRTPVITSARRWLRHGIWSTIWLMWRLRAAYFFGADPDALALRYGYRPRSR